MLLARNAILGQTNRAIVVRSGLHQSGLRFSEFVFHRGGEPIREFRKSWRMI